ncbi:GntR family transcriptional regulator [Planotetraspora silvatica]|uniref:GntR family transcriptional regulator n=1 Tax=Planotetraspora silvatica TaxID=234614 RepID=A0A8J3XS59_9ACTN|nr:GntR family transcriptional regulator [Planotetraspora silvatica]GII50840.1 GntR family transcriptional regulator [Planotetraspora silvatica]
MDEGTRYLPIADALRRKIVSGELAEGDRLPSTPEIEREYSVSNGVARKVLNTLIQEGLAIARTGSGTYVRSRPQLDYLVCSWHRNAHGGSPFKADMEGRGSSGTWDFDSRTATASSAVRERLALEEPEGDAPDVMQTDYLYRRDGAPAQLATSWEPLRLTRGTPIVLPEEGPHAGLGVVERMRQIGIEVTHSADYVSARLITAEEARALAAAKGDIVLVRSRTYYADVQPVETADIVTPADRYRLLYGTSMWDAQWES